MSDIVSVGGVNRELGNGVVTIGGSWRELTGGWATASGVWKQILSSGLAVSEIPVGALIKINENGVGVNYRVVHQGLPSSLYDASCNGTWVMRETCKIKMAWDATNNDYQNSDAHSYLNSTFLGLFNNNTQSVIKQVKIPYQNGTGTGGSIASGTNGLSTKIFLLGGYELNFTTKTNSKFPIDGACLSYFAGTAEGDDKLRATYDNGDNAAWTLRSANKQNTTYVWQLNIYGKLNTGSSCKTEYAIRPAMVLDGRVNPAPNADGSYTLL